MALKVLLADDSMTAQNMGKKILADAGFDVATVSNGAAAIKKVAEYKPNIVILDIYMPGYTGLEVCERIRATDTMTPVLLTVGKLEPFRQEDIDNVHADAIIIKPFEATDLINTVQKFVDQADLAASKAAVPPPPPVVEMPPPPPPAQLSEEDLAFLRGEVTEQAPPEPASNAVHATAMPDFADLLAAPQNPVGHAEPAVALNDFELPTLTQEDFAMLQDANAPAAPVPAETPAFASPAIELLAPPPAEAPAFVPEPEVAAEPAPHEMPVFQLDESLSEPHAELPAVSMYETAPAVMPVQPMPVYDSAAPVLETEPVAEAAMAAVPVFEPAPEAYVAPAPELAPEPVFAAEAAYAPEPVIAPEPVFMPESAAPALGLHLVTETAAPEVEPALEPILETAPAMELLEVAPPAELEPLELEQSGPQPTSDVVVTETDLAPAYEFIGAHGTTPVDEDIEAISVPHNPEPEHEALVNDAFLDLEAAATPAVAAAATSQYGAAPELTASEADTVASASGPVEPAVPLDLNYATVAGVVHRVFDRYKSQMIADIVRELSKQK